MDRTAARCSKAIWLVPPVARRTRWNVPRLRGFMFHTQKLWKATALPSNRSQLATTWGFQREGLNMCKLLQGCRSRWLESCQGKLWVQKGTREGFAVALCSFSAFTKSFGCEKRRLRCPSTQFSLAHSCVFVFLCSFKSAACRRKTGSGFLLQMAAHWLLIAKVEKTFAKILETANPKLLLLLLWYQDSVVQLTGHQIWYDFMLFYLCPK